MANNLQETIEEILAELLDIDWGEEMSIRDDYLISATEAILQAVRDVIGKSFDDFYEAGYNQCRADILKELGGGSSES